MAVVGVVAPDASLDIDSKRVSMSSSPMLESMLLVAGMISYSLFIMVVLEVV